MMHHYDIEKLRCLPIEQVAEQRLGLRVEKHRACCPMHDDHHPSLIFSTKYNTASCFVCGKTGMNPIDLVMAVRHMSFVEACRWLGGREIIEKREERKDKREWLSGSGQGLYSTSQSDHKVQSSSLKVQRNESSSLKVQTPLDTEYLATLVARPVLNAEARHFLFEERHYSPEAVAWLGISSISHPTPCRRYGKPFYDAPSLLYPYRDIDGRVLNVQGRYLGDASDGTPRFKFPKGSDVHIFNLPILKCLAPGEPLYVSEGVTDCIAHLSVGHKAVAIPSATLLKPSDLDPIKDLNLHIYPDNDMPGERLFLRLRDICPQIVRHQLPAGCKDFSQTIYQN